jgi:hypothetical protein
MRSIAELVLQLEQSGLSLWVDGDQIRYRGAPELLNLPAFLELKDRKPEAIEFLRIMGASANLPPMTSRERPDFVPASQAQQMIHALGYKRTFAPRSISVGFRLWNGAQTDIRQQAINSVAERHEILRTVFRDGPRGLEQVVLPAADVSVHVQDLGSIDRNSRRATLFREILPAYRRQPFDDAVRPPLRMGLFILNEDEVFLSLDSSRLALDRYSWQLIIREMTIFTRAARAKTRPRLRRPVFQFADYTLWEQQVIAERGKDAYAHWSAALQKAPPLKLGGAPREPPPYSRDRISDPLSSDQTIAVKALAAQHGLPVSAIMSASVLWLLGQMTGQEKFSIGLQTNQRTGATQDFIGPFSRLAPLIADHSGNPGLLQLAQRWFSASLIARSPIHFLAPETAVEHMLNRVVLSFVTRPSAAERVTLEASEEDAEEAVANQTSRTAGEPDFFNDLAIAIVESETSIRVRFDFAPARVEREMVRRLAAALPRFLENGCAEPNAPASGFSLERAAQGAG